MTSNTPFKIFNKFPEIKAGISVNSFGSMRQKNGNTHQKNIKNFLNSLNIDPKKAVFMEQIHGNNISVVKNHKERIIKDSDGLITGEKNIFLCTTTADCLPVIFYDPILRIVGILHIGYRGLLGGIVNRMVSKLKKQNSIISNIIVGVGPAIEYCCYDVPDRRIIEFKQKYKFLKNFYKKTSNKYFLNLKETFKQILVNSGVKKKNINILDMCTSCNQNFFSYRKSKGTSDRFVTVIGQI